VVLPRRKCREIKGQPIHPHRVFHQTDWGWVGCPPISPEPKTEGNRYHVDAFLDQNHIYKIAWGNSFRQVEGNLRSSLTVTHHGCPRKCPLPIALDSLSSVGKTRVHFLTMCRPPVLEIQDRRSNHRAEDRDYFVRPLSSIWKVDAELERISHLHAHARVGERPGSPVVSAL
jgi:hypothetical protein